MYKSYSAAVLEEMEERGDILVTIKPGWEQSNAWCARPSFISYQLGHEREHIFTCYFAQYSNEVQITDVESTELISSSKSLVDAYMYVALKGLVEFANSLGAKGLVFDSFISAAADHMFDLGFNVTCRGISGGSRGCKSLKD